MNPLSQEESDIQELVRKAQKGDTEAFGKVYDHYFAPVYRYTAFRLPSDMVEDLVADIFVQAWEKLHTYAERKNISFGAWLFRIARHKVIDTYRSQRHFEEIPEEIPDEDAMNKADNAIKHKDLLSQVRSAMDKIPKRYREILLLAYMAELPHDEIARVLRISEGSVRVLKFRALKKLEEVLPSDIQQDSAS